MFDRVTSTRHILEYPGVAGLMCREHAFPPIPSERITPLAEFLTSQGRFSLIAGVGALVGEARKPSILKFCTMIWALGHFW